MEKEILEKDMTPIFIKDLGMRFATEKSKERRRFGLYQCQYCGKEFESHTLSVKQGNTKSCGCQSKKYRNPHGMREHRLYDTWNNMKARCTNPKNPHYKNYGARGIQVCDRWLDINNFVEDMYSSWEEGLSLDRIDVDGNYEPDNCRWATKEVQNRNTREIKSTNKSGFRGVSYDKAKDKWTTYLTINSKNIYLGSYKTALEAAKVYERYVRLNNLEHNFTPVLSEEEIEEINKQKDIR